MTERYALVTGSSRGIGRAIALRLAQEAEGVAVHYFKDKKSAEKVVQDIRRTDRKSRAFQADLMSDSGAGKLVEGVLAEFGSIDVLVNNFGPILVKDWKHLTEEDWRTVLQGNLESAYYTTRAVLPGMRKNGWGRIVNIGYSRAEQLSAYKTIVPYAVAKTGLLILTRSVAAAEAGSGITVNMVSPGLMEGGVLPQSKKIPAGRLGTYEDIANPVAFLASEEASYITGTNLVVAGGWKL